MMPSDNACCRKRTEVIDHMSLAQALRSSRRLVILDHYLTPAPFRFLNVLGDLAMKPFGSSYPVGRHKPLEEMRNHLSDVRVQKNITVYSSISLQVQNRTETHGRRPRSREQSPLRLDLRDHQWP